MPPPVPPQSVVVFTISSVIISKHSQTSSLNTFISDHRGVHRLTDMRSQPLMTRSAVPAVTALDPDVHAKTNSSQRSTAASVADEQLRRDRSAVC